jgi:DNA-binding transcriptional LysR family regulator
LSSIDDRFGHPKRPPFCGIAASPFSGLSGTESSSGQVDAVFRAEGTPMQDRPRCRTPMLALRFVKEGLRAGIMDGAVYEREKDGIKPYSLEELVPEFELGLMTRRGGCQSPHLAAFVSFIRQDREALLGARR